MLDDRQAYRQRGWWRDQTFLDDLRTQARRNPAKPAVACAGGRGTRVLNYAELAKLTDRCAGALLQLGVRPGDMIAIHLTNRWELAPLFLGCMRAGVQVCTLLPNYRRQNIETVLGLTRPRVLITMAEVDGFPLGELSVELAQAVPELEHVVQAAGPGSAEALGFEQLFFGTAWEEKFAADLDHRELGPDDPYIVFFTSGTTGEPKGAVHTLNTLHAAIRGEAGVFGLGEDVVMATVTINTHYTGLVQGMLMPLMLGGTMAYLDVAESAMALDLFAQAGVTTLYVAPWFLRNLLDEQHARPRSLTTLRWVICGSSPVSPHLIEEVEEEFGLRLFSLWGMTENGPVTITRPQDPPDWAAHSDGSPISDMQLRIDPLPGRGEHAEGVLWVRGPTQCLGYYKRDQLYASYLDADGYFNTGDLVRPDGRGGIRVTGRIEETIFRHAISVPISQLETTIERHAKVHRATVIGLPAGRGEDEMICAVVVPKGDPLSLDELREHVREAGVMEIHWPERLELVAEFPVTLTGKIRKVELKKRYAEGG
jgi:cyclohexanecarboxylate-CoA ligase